MPPMRALLTTVAPHCSLHYNSIGAAGAAALAAALPSCAALATLEYVANHARAIVTASFIGNLHSA